MSINVSAEANKFEFKRIYNISVDPNTWVKDTDYTLSLRMTGASGAERKFELGTADNYGTLKTSCLFVVGDTVSVTATPDKDKHSTFNPATASGTPTMNDKLELKCNKFVTVTAPKGPTIDAGTLTNYYVYTFLAPVDQSAENGTTATFHFDKNMDYFYRVRHPQGATYWNYVKLSKDADGSYFMGNPGSNFGVYDFSSNPERQKLTVTMTAEGENTFSITLQTTTAGAWDGTTQTEPKTDENGVYQIGTGAALAWFVAKSKDADVSGVLTANINLSKYVWLNISSSKKVELNGAGHEITGLNATTGLFAQIGSNSYIHDLTIRGAVSGKGSAGAIVGYACGAGIKIEHCFNYASITSTGNNVGGLVGYTYQNAVIKDCANFGPVTGGSSVGGIIGSTVGNGSTITGCYNTAEISATGSKADGISGEQNGSFNRRLEAGSYTLTLSYVKDAASKGGSDTAYVSVLTLAGMAHVIVENTTFPKAEGAAWDGTLVDTWLELKADSPMMNCIFTALGDAYPIEESKGYISSINGLAQMAGGPTSGWMGTLNDWFTNFGFSNFTVANGALHAGDEIRVMYTRTAEDLGGSWNSTDTRLKALKFSAGKLTPTFSGDVFFGYTLTVPKDTTLLRVTPTAANKNYQVRTYLGTQAEGREYARASLIPVQNGSVITVVSADESWPTMNVTNEGELRSDGKKTYTVTVRYGSGDEAKSDDADITFVTVAGAIAIAGEGNAYTVTVPSGTEVTADSFNIKRSDSKATVGALTRSGNVWSFTVTAEDGTTAKTYTVTVSTASLPIPVKPATDNTKPASRLPFTDVSTSDWFYDDVKFVYENDLFSGTDSRSFSPSASMTRAMLVTVLYRLEGEPDVAGRSSFADTRSGAYYEKAVIWAAANGIVTGTSSTSFSPDAKVTREQLAAILYRYAQYKKLDTSASEKLSSFSDAGEMSGYANAALGWAVAERLVNGASGKLMPKGYAARAQVAAIFHRFVENVVK